MTEKQRIARRAFRHSCSPIRTVTVGPGLSPDQPLARVADFGAVLRYRQ